MINLGVSKGLSNNYIEDITQDIDGCFWIATDEGINRFNGSTFDVPKRLDNSLLVEDDINCILASKNSSIIFIGSRTNGLYIYDYHLRTIQSFPIIKINNTKDIHKYGLASNLITSLSWGDNGLLWIGYYDYGIDSYNINTKQFTHYNKYTCPEFKWNSVWCLEEINNKVFIGHNHNGLSVIDLLNNKVSHFTAIENSENSLAGNNVLSLCADNQGLLWCGTNKGLSLFNTTNNTFKTFNRTLGNSTLKKNIIRDLKISKDNLLYIGAEFTSVQISDLTDLTMNKSVFLKTRRLENSDNNSILGNFTIRSIFIDQYKNIWIGTYGGGIVVSPHKTYQIQNLAYRLHDYSQYSLSSPTAWGLEIDEHGYQWVGTDGNGIDIVSNNKVIKRISTIANIKKPAVLCIKKDSFNNMWIGCYNDGLLYYNTHNNTSVKIKLSGSKNIDIRDLYLYKNILYIGSDSGLYAVNTLTKKQINYWDMSKNGMNINLIRCVYRDKKNNILIGTYGEGLGIFSPSMTLIKKIQQSNGLISNRISAITQDSENNLWIGTLKGLMKIDQDYNILDTLTTKKGLSNNRIKSLIEVSKGQLWISTEYGINNIRLKDNNIQLFVSRDIPIYGFKAKSVASDGENIYWGSLTGLWLFNPKKFNYKEQVTHPEITSIQYNKRSFKEGRNNINFSKPYATKFNYYHNTINFSFNEKDIALSNFVKYSYRIKEINENWSLPSTNNRVLYRNLPPGDYNLELKSWIFSKKQNISQTKYSFTILPPFWLTWWFKTLIVLVIFLIIFFIVYHTTNNIIIKNNYELEKKQRKSEQAINNERMQFYTTITHELKTPLTLILGPLNDFLHSPNLNTKEKKIMKVININANRLLTLTNQIMELRKLDQKQSKLIVHKGQFDKFLEEIFNSFYELYHKKDITLIADIEKNMKPIYFDSRVISIIIYNLLNNALKYTSKGVIKIIAKQNKENNDIIINIIDTGIGIPKDKIKNIYDRWYRAHPELKVQGTGIGLNIVKSMIALHEAKIDISSKENIGTNFTLYFSGSNNYPNATHEQTTESSNLFPYFSNPVDIDSYKETNDENIFNKNNTGISSINKNTVLIVEDENNIAEYISDSLSENYNTIIANNGEKALELLKIEKVQLVISDLMMPGMDGIELCEHIKTNPSTSSILFIMLTAQEQLSYKEEAYKVGADSYLTKPFSSTLLKSRIDNLVTKNHSDFEKINQIKKKISVSHKKEIIEENLNYQDQEFLENVKCLIIENLTQCNTNINFLAENLNMSTSTLYRKFKTILGISTKKYVNKIIMEQAERLLLSKKYNINEISDKLGFSSPEYFRKSFKDFYNVSPSYYIKNLSNLNQVK